MVHISVFRSQFAVTCIALPFWFTSLFLEDLGDYQLHSTCTDGDFLGFSEELVCPKVRWPLLWKLVPVTCRVVRKLAGGSSICGLELIPHAVWDILPMRWIS